jgi:hypothetical protein
MATRIPWASLSQEMIARNEAQLQKQNQTKRAADCGRPGKRSAAPSRQGKNQGYPNGQR